MPKTRDSNSEFYIHNSELIFMVKQKFYVVWKGREAGVFTSWDACKKQIEGFAGAEYKSFETREAAEKAFGENSKKHIYQNARTNSGTLTPHQKAAIGKPIANSISVVAASLKNPGVLEYQGVETTTKRRLFSMGPFPEGTVNIGEFLAIVHGLAYLKKHNSKLPLYSDSRTAISWIKKKAIKTNLERNSRTEELFALVDRAILWLNSNPYPNKILKWETEAWGENPADFGRK